MQNLYYFYQTMKFPQSACESVCTHFLFGQVLLWKQNKINLLLDKFLIIILSKFSNLLDILYLYRIQQFRLLKDIQMQLLIVKQNIIGTWSLFK